MPPGAVARAYRFNPLDLYEMFCLEPYAWHPSEYATLTDYQIEHQYIRSNRKRAEQIERDRKGLPPLMEPGRPDESEAYVPKRDMVNGLMKDGWKVADAEKCHADYTEKWIAAYGPVPVTS
ncbi:hypothetical protein FRUB_10264 [Fimbriiglobus ruber]|uniref:Uncharacterized protein n=2 Tax=Fimbriiglobus ruber TaxID=1908690 RepID=A0A225D030_9BACT|nr:hypothetical protein FRUB_10264 [Fimbriiglobus ruber]